MLVFLLMPACQDKDVHDSGTDSALAVEPSTESQPEVSVEEPLTVLEEGRWLYSDIAITEEDCGSPQVVLDVVKDLMQSVEYDLNYVADHNYHLSVTISEDEQVSTTCINDAEQFRCEDLTLVTPARDSIVTEIYTSSGSIFSSTRIDGTVVKRYLCEGPDCEEIAQEYSLDFPCSMIMEYTFNYFDESRSR